MLMPIIAASLIGERGAVGISRLVGPTHQDPSDSRGLCGGVLGRNDTLLGVPAGLQGQVERALERWACRIVKPQIHSHHRVFN